MKISQWIGLFFWIVTQRIPFVKYDSNGTFFQQIWHKQLNFFEYDSKIWIFSKNKRLTEFNLFSSNMTKELAFFLEYDEKNWTLLFLEYDAQNWTFFLMTQKRLNISKNWKNCFFQKNDSKNWNSFFKIKHDSKN